MSFARHRAKSACRCRAGSPKNKSFLNFDRGLVMSRCLVRAASGFALAAIALGVAAPAVAQDWPSKPIRLIVPFGQGGLVDAVLAVTKQGVEDRLGQRLVVEHRPGASGNIGAQAVVSAPADGYTFLIAPPNQLVVNQFLFPKLGYEPLRDLVPVTLLVEVPLVLSVSDRHPVKTLREFLDHARANVGRVNYGSPGIGTPPHAAAAALARAAGLDVVHVPYRGGNAAGVGLISNEVQFMVIAFASLQGQIRGGQVRPIAVAASERLAPIPNVPTFTEAGFANLAAEIPRSWWGVAAARGTPEAIVQRMASAWRAAIQTPEARDRLRDTGLVAVGSTPVEFGQSLPAEARRWEALVKSLDLKPE